MGIEGEGPQLRESSHIDRLDRVLKGTSENPQNTKYGYESTVKPYGFSLKVLPDGAVVYDPRGITNLVDRIGDRITRRVDDHLRSHRGLGLRTSHGPSELRWSPFTAAKRARGEAAAIVENAQRLGIGHLYKLRPDGTIQLTDPTIITEGINLQDIFRVDHPALREIDRFAALQTVGSYAQQLHSEHGAVGELHSQYFVFRTKDGSQVADPTLVFPNIVPNIEKYQKLAEHLAAHPGSPNPSLGISEESIEARRQRWEGKTGEDALRMLNEPKAVDMLDLLMVVATEELRRSNNDWESARRAVDALLQGYVVEGEGAKVIETVLALAKRGRIVTQGDERNLERTEEHPYKKKHGRISRFMRPAVAWHNKIRLAARPEITTDLRQLVIDEAQRFTSRTPETL